jgi:ABC-type phosphate transport system substrate-binding protein
VGQDLRDTVISNVTNNVVGSTLAMISDFDIPDLNQDDLFVTPMVSYPMVLIYNLPILNSTLILTPELLADIIRYGTIRWKNSSIVALNPGLETIGSPARMIYNSQLTGANQMIIDYLFPGQNLTQDGDWSIVAAATHVRAPSDEQVLALLSNTPNYFAFVPLPTVLANTYFKIQFGKIGIPTLNGTIMAITSAFDPLKYVTYTEGTELRAVADESIPQWPLNVFGYFAYQENATGDSTSLTEELRFAYWTFNNSAVIYETNEMGFSFVNASTQLHLLESKFHGEKLLVFHNLSVHGRPVAVLVISLVLTFLFFVGLVYGLLVDGLQNSVQVLLVLFGLILSAISYIIWYLPPSETWICITRMWFYGFGMASVLSSICLFGFVLKMLHLIRVNQVVTLDNPYIYLIVVALIIMVTEFIILMIWTLKEHPSGREIIVDSVNWTSRYTCTTKSWTMDLVQYAYFCLLAVLTPIVINCYWDKLPKDRIQDAVTALQNSNTVLMALVVIIVVTTLNTQNDDQHYITNVILWTLVEGIVAHTWSHKFISKLFQKFRVERTADTQGTRSGNNNSIAIRPIGIV